MQGIDLSQFVDAFFDEGRERLASINEALVVFESDALDDAGFAALRRDAHTIKGSALMLGVQDVGAAAHLFEDAVEYLIKHSECRTAPMIQFLFDIHDSLADRLQAVDSVTIDTADFRRRHDALLSETTVGDATQAVDDEEAVSEEAVSEEAVSEEAVSEKAVSEEAVSEEAVSEEAVSEEAVSEEAVSEEAVSEEAVSEEAVSVDLSQFVESFFDEGRQRLASINEALVVFESGALDDAGFAALRRDAHTIKGSALMLGVQDVGAAAHLFEDAVEHQIKDSGYRTAPMIQFLFDIHDSLADRLQAVDSAAIDTADFRRRHDALLAEAAAAADVLATEADEGQADVLGEDIVAEETASVETIADTEHADQDNDETSEAEAIEEDIFRPDVTNVKAKVASHSGSGRFIRVDAERLNLLSGQLIELSTGKAFGGKLVQDVHVLQKQMEQLRRLARGIESEMESAPASESFALFDRHMEWLHRATKHLIADVDYNVERQDIMLDDLRDQVLGLMLRPLDTIFPAFPRAVRDTANRYGKKARLVIADEKVECDQSVVEALMEPLVHLLNNAIAHGIESPEERLQAGKPEAGQITLLSTQSGSEIHIEVIDDGRGIDPERVKKVAVERGVTTQYEADEMSDAEVFELIFRSGFSTRDEIDETSGRGVGMNVVQDTVRRLTGVIRINTEIGKGTRFLISLPVSIAVQRALIFRIGDQKFGMLIHMLEQVVSPKPDDVKHAAGGRMSLTYSGQKVPLVDLRQIISHDDASEANDIPLIVVARHIDGFVGIVVDELYADTEIIVRELDPYLKRYQAQGLMGNTITDDGSVVLLMEPYGIKEMGRTAPHQVAHDMVAEDAILPAARVLLVDDSIIARQVEKSLLESMGMTVETAIDGMDAIEKLEHDAYDVVVSDLEMPRLDGFGLVRRMRNDRQYRHIPILIVSTRESPEDRLKGMEAGADGYLIKQQLAQGELHATLKRLLEPLTSADESNRKRPSQDAPIV
ncbi:MAG: Hpt domain-containing protein [Mariprofundaceae bacterium]